jgi:hypothetical protein
MGLVSLFSLSVDFTTFLFGYENDAAAVALTAAVAPVVTAAATFTASNHAKQRKKKDLLLTS